MPEERPFFEEVVDLVQAPVGAAVGLARSLYGALTDLGAEVVKGAQQRINPHDQDPSKEQGDPAPGASGNPTGEPPIAERELAIENYDQLGTAELIARLGDLTRSARADVGAYQRAHRNRRTVLNRIAQLDAEDPDPEPVNPVSATEAARPANKDDATAVVGLLSQLNEVLLGSHAGALLVADRGFVGLDEPALSNLMADPDKVVFVGTFADVPVGFAIIEVRANHDGSAPTHGVITVFYVEQDARRVGVGEALYEACVTWSTRRGLRDLDATVLPGDREIKAFFETCGLRARSLTMHRQLGA